MRQSDLEELEFQTGIAYSLQTIQNPTRRWRLMRQDCDSERKWERSGEIFR